MKIEKMLSILAVIIVALRNVHLITSIPKSNAITRCYGSRVLTHPCSTLQSSSSQDGWNLTPHRRDIFNQFNDIFTIPSLFYPRMLHEQYQYQLAQFRSSSRTGRPRHFEIREDDSKMELMLDVPGIRASDIKIQLEGKVVKIIGSRNHKHNDTETRSSAFEQMFTIDPEAVDIANLNANLVDGLLVLSVPKIHEPKLETGQHVIPIEITTKEEHQNGSVIFEQGKKKEDLEKHTNESRDSNDLEITEEDI